MRTLKNVFAFHVVVYVSVVLLVLVVRFTHDIRVVYDDVGESKGKGKGKEDKKGGARVRYTNPF